MATSPFYAVYNCHSTVLKTSFFNSHFSHSFNSILYSQTKRHESKILNTFFTHIFNSALVFVDNQDEPITKKCNFIINDKGEQYDGTGDISNVIIKPDQYEGDNKRPYFNGNCGNIVITGCTFDSCSANEDGGSLHVEQDCTVIIHNTIFKNSQTDGNYGGAAVIYQKRNENGYDFNDDPIEKLDIQYVCFQDCFCKTANKLYGSAIFSSAKNTILFYASTVNCPGTEHPRSNGAQFDLQSNIATSRNVNSTGGNSQFCGSIEYRRTKEGFFLFQTISKSLSRFTVSYTDIETKDLELMKSNFIENELITDDDKSQNFPGIIFIRRTDGFTQYDVKISDFCFYNNNLGGNEKARIISRQIKQHTQDGENHFYTLQEIKISLINCYYSCEENQVFYSADNFNNDLNVIENCHKELKTNEIHQLLLGECKGDVIPLDKPTSVSTSTPSIQFTRSNLFSHSDAFSKSDSFSSCYFSKSNEFSETNDFTKSNMFSKSSPFTESDLPKSENVPGGGNLGGDGKGKGKNAGMIAGIAVAAAAVLIAIIVAAVFLIKKKNNFVNEEEVETIDGDTNSVNQSNPIYDKAGNDDPFKEDFDQ